MANLDLARLKALAEKAKVEPPSQYRSGFSPDVILSLIARLEKIERLCERGLGYDLLTADFATEVLRLFREEKR